MTTNQDIITGTIRTAVPGAVGFGIARLVTAVPAVGDAIAYVDGQIAEAGFAGVTVEFVATTAAVGGAIAGYYWIARKLGARWPVIEKWLLGSAKTPTYAGKS